MYVCACVCVCAHTHLCDLGMGPEGAVEGAEVGGADAKGILGWGQGFAFVGGCERRLF